MTREEFERGLAAKLEDIRDYYRQYNPESVNKGEEWLTMTIHGRQIFANNKYFQEDKELPVNFYLNKNNKFYSFPMT